MKHYTSQVNKKKSSLVSSVHKTFFQQPLGLSVWTLANYTEAAMFFLESSVVLLATLPWTSLLNILLIVGSWTLTLANVRWTLRLEVTQGSSVILWTCLPCSRSDLWWSTFPAKGNSGFKPPPFVHNLSDCGFYNPNPFWDSYKTTLFVPWYTSTNMCCNHQALIEPWF